MNKCWYCVNALKFPFDKECWYFFFLTTWLNLRNKCGSLVTVQINLQPSPPSYCAFPPCICHFNCSTFFISSKFLHSVTYFWHYKFISFCSLLFANYYNSVMLPFCRTNVQPSSSSPCHSSGSLESLIESFQKQLTFEWTLLLLAINFVSFHCCGKKMALLCLLFSFGVALCSEAAVTGPSTCCLSLSFFMLICLLSLSPHPSKTMQMAALPLSSLFIFSQIAISA